MRAIMVGQFGGPEVLQASEVALPQQRPGEVLVRGARRRHAPPATGLVATPVPAELPSTPAITGTAPRRHTA